MRWTEAQEQVLFDYGYFGVAECRRILHREHGVKRSEAAIQAHASRIGASLRECHICTQCGTVVPKVCTDGLCRVCHQKQLNQKQRQMHQRLIARMRREQGNADAEYKEEAKVYRSLLQANRRLRRKIESYGQSVEM